MLRFSAGSTWIREWPGRADDLTPPERRAANGGGSDYNYREFTPLLYTAPFREVGADVLASDDNIAAQHGLGADTNYPAGQRQQMLNLARRMEGSRGGCLPGSDGTRTQPAYSTCRGRWQSLSTRGARAAANSSSSWPARAGRSRSTVRTAPASSTTHPNSGHRVVADSVGPGSDEVNQTTCGPSRWFATGRISHKRMC